MWTKVHSASDWVFTSLSLSSFARAAIHKIPQTGCLNNRNFFSQSWMPKSKIKVAVGLFLFWGLPLGLQMAAFLLGPPIAVSVLKHA